MNELLILIAACVWVPLIPLRILLHAGISFWRRLQGTAFWVIVIYVVVIDMYLYQIAPIFLEWRFAPLPGAVPLGIFLVIAALLFHLWTIQTLGLSTLLLRPEMNPEKNKVTLIATGPYRWVRHPFYLVDWFMLLGLSLITSSWLVLLLLGAALATIPLVTFFEEKELVERFGEPYREYQRQVPRLIPRWR